MKARCFNLSNASWGSHGGRGIGVCERWLSFENFFDDMGEKPTGKTLDRIDNDGNYELQNCRWATPAEQSRNTRRSISHEVAAEILDTEGTHSGVAALFGVDRMSVSNIRRGIHWTQRKDQ